MISKRNQRRVVVGLSILLFLWFITFMNFNIFANEESYPDASHNARRDDILRQSQQYVKKLAEDTRDMVDGPFAAHQTAYDMKKTLAVMLQDLLERMDKVEQKLDQQVSGRVAEDQKNQHESTRKLREDKPQQNAEQHKTDKGESLEQQNDAQQKPVHMNGLIMGQQDNCLPSISLGDTQYPNCVSKIMWMRDHWQSDPCYSRWGVDGSDCSFRQYLSEVENWCPVLPGHPQNQPNITSGTGKKAQMTYDLEALLQLLIDSNQKHNYEFIRERIRRLWPQWVNAGQDMTDKFNMSHRHQKRINIHMGFLSSGWKIAETSSRGGPLGELVQWSDIIASLYLLGHHITITSELDQLGSIVSKLPLASVACQIRADLPVDMIFSDIVGLRQFKAVVKEGYGKFSCLLRIIDSFGTEPAFNLDSFAKANRLKSPWGMQNLNTQQFLTMFPHSPDNSFMGFVVEQHLNQSEINILPRNNQAVVYGKAEYMWEGHRRFLDMVHEHMEIHSTVFTSDTQSKVIPPYVINHGILSGPELHKLLRQSKLFIGLGFPYEGPAPLEAVGQGTVFINPKFTPPHNRENTRFFREKPTLRELTSQHPYCEEFIGEPMVQTIDIENPEQVHTTIKKVMGMYNNTKVEGHMPHEYTFEGMLQRVSAYVEHQDFCNPTTWPPSNEIQYELGELGESCKVTCAKKQRVCERSYFSQVNSVDSLQKYTGVNCSDIIRDHLDVLYPALRTDTAQCVLQPQPMLYSCVGHSAYFKRLCPCRTRAPEQWALCTTCVQDSV